MPTEQQQQPALADALSADKVQLKAPGFSVDKYGNSRSCFAGDDDELVVVSSSKRRLFIWSVPEGRGDRTIDQPMLSLPGHQHRIINVKYCKATSTLVSSDEGGVIRLWTPTSTGRY